MFKKIKLWWDKLMEPPKCTTKGCLENIDGYCCTVATHPDKCPLANKPNNKLHFHHMLG